MQSPAIEYFQTVLFPLLAKLGCRVECQVLRRGYYPAGGGEICVRVWPLHHLEPLDMTDFGTLTSIHVQAFVSRLSKRLGDEMARHAVAKLRSLYPSWSSLITDEVLVVPSHESGGACTGLIVLARTSTGCVLARSALGKKGMSGQATADEAVDALRGDIEARACVDEYMQDQLVVLMALARGKSRVACGPLSLHTRTAIHFAQLMTGVEFKVERDTACADVERYVVSCDGMAFVNKQISE